MIAHPLMQVLSFYLLLVVEAIKVHVSYQCVTSLNVEYVSRIDRCHKWSTEAGGWSSP